MVTFLSSHGEADKNLNTNGLFSNLMDDTFSCVWTSLGLVYKYKPFMLYNLNDFVKGGCPLFRGGLGLALL